MRKGTPPKRSDRFKFLITDVSHQPNLNECEVYAIANAVSNALRLDLTTQGYMTSEMRPNQLKCFGGGRFISCIRKEIKTM